MPTSIFPATEAAHSPLPFIPTMPEMAHSLQEPSLMVSTFISAPIKDSWYPPTPAQIGPHRLHLASQQKTLFPSLEPNRAAPHASSVLPWPPEPHMLGTMQWIAALMRMYTPLTTERPG